MELLMLIAGVMLLWYFAPAIKAGAKSAETKTQVMAEGIILDSVETRARQYNEFSKKISDGELKIVSHDEVMSLVKVD